jgi:CDP-diacylglycerol--glycerol-3-phosphate 3-phosphatidyltransferase
VTLYALKPRFVACLYPMAQRLAAARVTANQVTIATVAGSLAVGGMIALGAEQRWPFLLLPLWLAARMALNAVDGVLAREFGQQSRLGAYLNELGDVLSDCALYLPFACLAPFAPSAVGLVVLLAVLSEFAGALGPLVGATRRHDGPLGKSDRALAFGALALWIGLGGATPDGTAWVMPILAGLLIWTIVNRVRRGLVEAGRAGGVR